MQPEHSENDVGVLEEEASRSPAEFNEVGVMEEIVEEDEEDEIFGKGAPGSSICYVGQHVRVK